MDLFACSAYQHSNLKDTIKKNSVYETFWNILPSIHSIKEVKSVVFEEHELEYQDI